MKLNSLLTRTFAVAAATMSTVAIAQSSAFAPAGNDWPTTVGNHAGQGYSGLTQINKANVQNVGLAWMVHTSAEPVTAPAAGPGNSATAQQTIPIVVDGVMYLDTPA